MVELPGPAPRQGRPVAAHQLPALQPLLLPEAEAQLSMLHRVGEGEGGVGGEEQGGEEEEAHQHVGGYCGCSATTRLISRDSAAPH